MKRKKRGYNISRKLKAQIHKSVFSLSRKDADYYLLKISKLYKEDKLFVESNNPNDPYINTSSTNDYELLQGYVNTSIYLLTIIEYGRNYYTKSCYLYPALFCFRLYLENVMKIIILKYSPNYDVTNLQHNLVRMWTVVQNHIELNQDTRNIGHLIADFQDHDKHACNLRFAYDLNKLLDTKDEIGISMHIDVTHIKTMFLHLYRLFDGLHERLIIEAR